MYALGYGQWKHMCLEPFVNEGSSEYGALGRSWNGGRDLGGSTPNPTAKTAKAARRIQGGRVGHSVPAGRPRQVDRGCSNIHTVNDSLFRAPRKSTSLNIR